MKQVATISTNGAEVIFDEGVFSVGGEGARIEQLIDYDKLGVLTWPSEDMKRWFYEIAAAAAATAQPASGAPPVSRRPLWIALIVIALLAVVGVAVGLVVMAQNRAATETAAQRASQAAELRSVYEKVVAVDSAVSVGINQRDYSAEVQDARAAVDAYSPPDAAASRGVV
ncbi:MAG: hypothetical protein Q8S43_04740 [Actinomycetota bacterium]|nr:hypothetical protein [Actinomycetota bacterium]